MHMRSSQAADEFELKAMPTQCGPHSVQNYSTPYELQFPIGSYNVKLQLVRPGELDAAA